jgi:hypothetical protein
VGRVRRALTCSACAGAVLAGAAGSAYASENLPSYGKCEAQAGGKYSNPGCTKLAKTAEKQKYEWHPLAAAVPFTQTKEHMSGEAVLEVAGGVEMRCRGTQTATGEYGPGSQLKNVVMVLFGCEAGGGECNSEGRRAGEVATRKLHGEPGVVKREPKEEKNVDGTDLTAEEGETIAELACGPEPGIVVKGGIVTKAQADSTGGTTGEYTNKMATRYEVEYVPGPSGTQIPRDWAPNGGGFSHGTHEAVVEQLEAMLFSPLEPASLKLTTVQESSPNTTLVELRQCESNVVC